MDFNDIQSAWDSEKTDNVVLPDHIAQIQSANTPLDKIKKNLKKELITQVIAVILMGFAPIIYSFPQETYLLYYLIYSLFTAVCIYYLTKLFLFYKRLNAVTLKTKDSLYETYFDIRLNMELYKTFGFALTPFVVLFMIGFIYYTVYQQTKVDIQAMDRSFIIVLFIVIVGTVLLMGIMMEVWVHYYYGKFAREIRKVLDELKEDVAAPYEEP